jgi:hypothetical protein
MKRVAIKNVPFGPRADCGRLAAFGRTECHNRSQTIGLRSKRCLCVRSAGRIERPIYLPFTAKIAQRKFVAPIGERPTRDGRPGDAAPRRSTPFGGKVRRLSPRHGVNLLGVTGEGSERTAGEVRRLQAPPRRVPASGRLLAESGDGTRKRA